MSFLRSVFSVSALTIVGRVTGYLRDSLLAYYVGATAITDALNLAIKIPSFFRRIFAEGAFHVSFLPAYSHANKSKGFAGMVLSLLLGILVLLILVVERYYQPLSDFILQDYPIETLEYFKKFAPLVFPYILFIALASFFSSILNAHGRFFATSISSAMGNVSILAFVWIVSIWTHQFGLLFSWGVLLSGMIQCVFLLVICWSKGYKITPQWPRWNQDIRSFLKKFWSGICSVSVAQINILIVPLLVSGSMPVGTLSCLSYADRLIQLPLSMIGVALSSVLLPMISEKIKDQDHVGADEMLSQALRFAWMAALPALVLLSCCALPMVITLYGVGKLTMVQLQTIAESVTMYSLGVPAYIFIKVLNARFFAEKDMRTPLIAGGLGTVVDILLAIALVHRFQHLGIAMAAIVSAWCNVAYLFYQLIRRNLWSFNPIVRSICCKSSIVGLMTAALVILVRLAFRPLDHDSRILALFYVMIVVIVCSASFIVGFWKVGILSRNSLKNMLHHGEKKR